MSGADSDRSRVPPPDNWMRQDLAYGFAIDRTLQTDYSTSSLPGESGRS